MAAAVIRLKRRLDDEPLDAVILNCKKRKTETDSENDKPELSTLLKFAGTIHNKQEDILPHLKKPSKTELEEQFKKHSVDINAKLRSQKQQDIKNNRYKVVSCLRSQSLNPDESVEEINKTELTIYDLETEDYQYHLENKEKSDKYVYDLYYTTSDDLGDASLEDYVNVYPYSGDLVFGSTRDNGLNEPESDDSEDSNAENNWKNDYPDESDMESINEDDMIEAMEKCDLDDLSSDDGEEGFVYSVDSEAAGFEEDIDDSDVQRYGERYARFKARHKNNVETTDFKQDLYYGDIDEEEYYY